MSDYGTRTICCGIKALAGLWSTAHALVNQINLKITSCIIKARARTGGRDEWNSHPWMVSWILSLLFLPPPQILGRSHFAQVGVALSKMRRSIRWVKGGVTIHFSPTAVQAPLCDPSQLCSSGQPPSSCCTRPTPHVPCSDAGAGWLRFVPTPAAEFCPGPAAVCYSRTLPPQIQNSFEKRVRERKETISSLVSVLANVFFIFSFSLNTRQNFSSDILSTAGSSREQDNYFCLKNGTAFVPLLEGNPWGMAERGAEWLGYGSCSLCHIISI